MIRLLVAELLCGTIIGVRLVAEVEKRKRTPDGMTRLDWSGSVPVHPSRAVVTHLNRWANVLARTGYIHEP
jgi:hypothetical protein